MLRAPRHRAGRAVAALVAVTVSVAPLLVAGAADAAPTPTPTSPSSTGATPDSGSAAADKAAPGEITFGIKPYTPGVTDGRGYFSFNASAGAHVHDIAQVVNYATKPITLAVAPADAVNTDTGGFGLIPPTKSADSVSSWTTIAPKYSTIVVPARSGPTSAPGRVLVPFDVVIPVKASPGAHVGGIVVTLRASVKSKSGQLFHLDQKVGTRIFVNVSGALHPLLAIEGMKASYSGGLSPTSKGDVTVTYRVHNTGNVVLGGRQTVAVTGWFGTSASARSVPDVPLLVPGGSAPVRVVVHGVLPTVVEHAHVSVAPLTLPGAVVPPAGPFTGSVRFLVIPWALVVVLLLILLLGLAWFLGRRRLRRRPPSGSHSAGSRRAPSGVAAGPAPRSDIPVPTGSPEGPA